MFRLIQMDIWLTQLLIIIYNHKYAGIDYDFHGWKYKVTTFGHWAAARAKYKAKVANILSNSYYDKVWKLSENLDK